MDKIKVEMSHYDHVNERIYLKLNNGSEHSIPLMDIIGLHLEDLAYGGLRIIACDFDGTLCTYEHGQFPKIGEPIQETIDALLAEQQMGSKIILWTCRIKEPLEDAINWCKERGIIFDAINDNIPEMIEKFGENPRKISYSELWDDKNVTLDQIRRRDYGKIIQNK